MRPGFVAILSELGLLGVVLTLANEYRAYPSGHILQFCDKKLFTHVPELISKPSMFKADPGELD